MPGIVTTDARRSPELRAVIFALKAANRDVRRRLYADARSTLAPEWQRELAERARTRLQQRVLVSTARVKVSTQGFTVTSAKARRPLRGGLVPARDGHVAEFGAVPQPVTVRARSPKGTAYSYTRQQNAMHVARRRRGYVAHPAAQRIGRRLLALWVQTIVRSYRDAAEGKAS